MTGSRALDVILVVAALALFSVATSPAPETALPVAPAPVAPRPAAKTLLVFSTSGCAPCKRLKETLADPATKTTLAGWTVEEVVGPSLKSRRYRVTSYPTLVAEVDGKEVDRHVGYLSPAELTAWLSPKEETPTITAKVGGPIAPDGTTEIDCDLPGNLHRRNTASKGLGNCVFTSIHHAALWQNVPQLHEFPKWLIDKGIPGGGYPEKVEKLIPQICKDRGMPVPDYIQIEGPDLEMLKLACRTGRMPSVTYSVSPTGRYGGRRIAHMVTLSHADDRWFAVLDNNYMPSGSGTPDNYEWMTPQEFSRAYGDGWAVILLSPPPPPVPRNQQ